MPTFSTGKSTKVYLDEFDMSAYLNQSDIAFTNEVVDTTAYGSLARTFLASQETGTLSLAGMYDAVTGAGSSDQEFAAILGSAVTPIVTVATEAGTIGNRALLARANSTSYTTASPIADLNAVTVDLQCSSDAGSNITKGLASGVQLTTGASIAFGALGNLASVNNTTSSANGGMATLHVTANTIDATTTIKVQHSTDDAVWADLITFTGVSASTLASQVSAVTGTVNQYLRVTASAAGSTTGAITTMVSFARF
jgi:hypothetical protein